MKNILYSIILFFINLYPLQAQLICKEGNHYIENSDGTTFFWLGDTAWELFHRLDKEEAVYYLDNRQEKGFTVIQAVILAEMEGLTHPNIYGDLPLINRDPLRPNENYFKHIDYIVQEANKRDMYMGLLPTWGSHVTTHETNPPIFTKQNAYEYGRFLGKRYKEKNVIWILGGDRNVHDERELEIWNAMAAGLTDGNGGKQLISYHPTGDISSHYWFHNEPWLSFNIVQSGHYRKFDLIYRYAGMYNQLTPAKPFVNAEPAYEDIAVRFWEYDDFEKYGKKKEDIIDTNGLIKDKEFYTQGFYDDYDIRMQAYWTYLSGAAGYTYGNNAIWQMYKPGTSYFVPCLTGWKEAMDRPGAIQMQYIKQLFTWYPLGSFHPDQSIIHGLNLQDENHITAVRSRNSDFLLIYLNKSQPVKIDTRKLSGNAKSYWYNPRTGEKKYIREIQNKGIESFTPPQNTEYGNDWILIIDIKNP